MRVLAALALGLIAVTAAQAQVAEKATVAAYDTFETRVPVADVPANPYDPDQIDITGEFTAPSGKKLTVPAFFQVEQETLVMSARERLRNMHMLKIYTGGNTWYGGTKLDYIVDDVRLIKKDGTEVVIGDFEKPDTHWFGSGNTGAIEHDLVHSGAGAFRLPLPFETHPNWPGINMDLSGQDWGEMKELRFFIYPATDCNVGNIGVEFYSGSDDKFQRGFPVGLKDGFKINAWNEVVWDLTGIGERKQVRPRGQGEFRLRFAPSEIGTYRYTVRRAGVAAPLMQGTLKAAASKRPGFLHVADPHARYVTFDNGKPLVLIGENVCWQTPAGVGDFDMWLTHLAAAGGNYIRVWMAPWANGIEWEKLGQYSQGRAADVDYILSRARKLGIHVMLCLDYHGALRVTEGSFSSNPYAARNGGPCQTTSDFMTKPEAKALYKKRLRYLVARYASYDNLLSWELFNEVDIIENYKSEVVAAWHQEMARHLKSIDPYAHIVTTSTANAYGDPALWNLPEMEYIQSHTYNYGDKGEEGIKLAQQHLAKFDKPFLIGEYGINGGDGTRQQDPTGMHIHDGAWAGVLGGSMGTMMTWWWDSYIEPENLYHHWTPVAKFAADIPATARSIPDDALASAYAEPLKTMTYDDVALEPTRGSWSEERINTPQTFVVGHDGIVANGENLASVMHGLRGHPKLHNPATFDVDYAQPGKFTVQINGVSGYGGAKLQVSLDGKLVIDKDWTNDGKGAREIYDFNGGYAVDMPVGKHTIKVENTGYDWFYVAYTLTGYRSNPTPNYHAVGLAAKRQAWLWLHNRQSNVQRIVRLKLQPTPIPKSVLTVPGLPNGAYAVEWWDTWTGKVTGTAQAKSQAGVMKVEVPGFPTDVACRIVGR